MEPNSVTPLSKWAHVWSSLSLLVSASSGSWKILEITNFLMISLIPKIPNVFISISLKYWEVSKSPLNPYKSLARMYISTICRLFLWFQNVWVTFFSFLFFFSPMSSLDIIESYRSILNLSCLHFFIVVLRICYIINISVLLLYLIDFLSQSRCSIIIVTV